MRPRLTAVVAMTADRIIGRDGTLPWHIPEDLAFFKRTTSGHPIVMGRKTFESIGRPLPKRRNIVLSRDTEWTASGVEVIHAPEELFTLENLGEQVFIIGGAEVYCAFLSLTDDILISHILADHSGDTRFPEYEKDFPSSESLESHEAFYITRHSRSD